MGNLVRTLVEVGALAELIPDKTKLQVCLIMLCLCTVNSCLIYVQIKRRLHTYTKEKNRYKLSAVVGDKWERCTSIIELRKVIYDIVNEQKKLEQEREREETKRLKLVEEKRKEREWEMEMEEKRKDWEAKRICVLEKERSNNQVMKDNHARNALANQMTSSLVMVREAHQLMASPSQVLSFFFLLFFLLMMCTERAKAYTHYKRYFLAVSWYVSIK